MRCKFSNGNLIESNRSQKVQKTIMQKKRGGGGVGGGGGEES